MEKKTWQAPVLQKCDVASITQYGSTFDFDAGGYS
jgi:hypothetical protein